MQVSVPSPFVSSIFNENAPYDWTQNSVSALLSATALNGQKKSAAVPRQPAVEVCHGCHCPVRIFGQFSGIVWIFQGIHRLIPGRFFCIFITLPCIKGFSVFLSHFFLCTGRKSCRFCRIIDNGVRCFRIYRVTALDASNFISCSSAYFCAGDPS